MLKNCKRCGLSEFRKNIVPGEGAQPAEVLFVGEAPGRSENVRGKPFCGPSGRILRQAIAKATEIAGLGEEPSYFITNIVKCRPTDSKGGKNRIPTAKEAWACREWLNNDITKTQASIVVLLGKTAKSRSGILPKNALCLVHPAYILRRGGAESPEFGMFVRALACAFETLSKKRQ